MNENPGGLATIEEQDVEVYGTMKMSVKEDSKDALYPIRKTLRTLAQAQPPTRMTNNHNMMAQGDNNMPLSPRDDLETERYEGGDTSNKKDLDDLPSD